MSEDLFMDFKDAAETMVESLKRMVDIVDVLDGNNSSFTEKLEKLEKESERDKEELESKRAKIEKLESKYNELREQYEGLVKENEKLSRQIAELQQTKLDKMTKEQNRIGGVRSGESRRDKRNEWNVEIARRINRELSFRGTVEQTKTLPALDASCLFKYKKEYSEFRAWLTEKYISDPEKLVPGSQHLYAWTKWHMGAEDGQNHDLFKNVQALK